MGNLVLTGATSGSITLEPTAVAGSNTITLPANTGTLLTTGSTGQVIPKAALPTGSVLQVVNTTKTDVFTTTSTSFVDVTGFSATITPTSASSKILVMISFCFSSNSGAGYPQTRILRDSTAVYVGDAAGSRTRALNDTYGYSQDNGYITPASAQFLDSPATTSAITYKLQALQTSGNTVRIGATGDDSDSSTRIRTASSIVLMEIAA
jgi:hypothetical protein